MRSLPLALLLPLIACDLFDPPGVDCTMMAAASVGVTVTDEAGAPLGDAEVVYSADGGAEQPCEDFGGGEWVCGWEVQGEVTVTARAEGYTEQSASVVVALDADGCHVVQEFVDLALPAECDPSLEAGLTLDVQDEDGELVPDAQAWWTLTGTDMALQACVDLGDGLFGCAYGQQAAVTVEVSAEGYLPWSQDLTANASCEQDSQPVVVVLGTP